MVGAIFNVVAVALGSLLGMLAGNRLSAQIQDSVVFGLCLVTLYIGVDNAGKTGNLIIPLLSLTVGVIIGELLDLHGRLEGFGAWLQRRFAGKSETVAAEIGSLDSRTRFITGFVTASLIFCIGPLAFVGSIQDGMGLPIGLQQIIIKSILDFFASIAFASTFGIGVAFSTITIFVVQGGLSLLGMLAGNALSPAMVNEMTATGGLLLMGLGLLMLGLKKPRMANYLPALVLAPLIVAVATALGIHIYPL